MTAFDTRTALLILGMVYLLLPVFTWVVLLKDRPPQVAWWCSGGFLLGLTILPVSLREHLPSALGWPPLSLLFYGAHLMRLQALRIELGKAWRIRTIIFATVALGTGFLWLQFGLKSLFLRALYNCIVSAGLLFYLAWLAWQVGRDNDSRNARWLAVYALVATAYIFRFFLILGGRHEYDVFTESISGPAIAATGLVTAIIGHFAYVGMALDRSRRRELEMVAAHARDEEALRLGYQIAQLQRQRSLGELSATLAHELVQPLTAVLTNAQVGQRTIGTTSNDEAAQRQLLSKIVLNIKRATEIIDRIRGYIQPSGNRMEKVDLNAVILNVVNLLADEARRHSVTIGFPAPAPAVYVNGDSIGLSQIVFNALRNAIDAVADTAEREITISCEQEGGRVILRICDTGPGLSDEALARLGTPFFTTKSKGMGLGFCVSRAIAEQHQATLSLANQASGRGAVVTLVLPALAPALQ